MSYERLFPIARGGMAEVWVGRRRGEEGFVRLVALKYMLPELLEDERFVTMFTDEAHLASNIQSAHVVHTHDLRRSAEGHLYLVMDLVVGASLATLYANATRAGERLPDAFLLEVLAQAAVGLHDAHCAKTVTGQPLELVHRDVSPQNILVGLVGYARVTDFGVARALHRRTRSQTGEHKGKYRYFSPEQCVGDRLDARSDVFSLGVVAWEALAGRVLFQGADPVAVMAQVQHRPIPRLDDVRPSVSSEVAEVVSKALARDPEARFETAEDMARALREVGPGMDREAISSVVRTYGGESLDRLLHALSGA